MRDHVVGDTDGAGLALGELGHGCITVSQQDHELEFSKALTLPGVDNGNIVIDDNVTTLDIAAGNQREVALALLESDGPVHKVKLVSSVNCSLYCDGRYIRQGSQAQARRDTRQERTRQPRGGAGCSTAWRSK